MSVESINNVSPSVRVQETKLPETKNSEVSKEPPKSSDKSWILWTGLAVLGAAGIYIATRGKAGKSAVEKTAQETVEQVSEKAAVNSEKLADDMKFIVGKIGKMNKKVEITPPKLQSEDLYNKILNLNEPFAKESRVIENFENGKLIEDTAKYMRKYVVNDEEVARIYYDTDGKLESYVFYDKGKFVEKINPSGYVVTTEKNANNLITREYNNNNLEKITTETVGKNGKSTLTVRVKPDGTVIDGQLKTYKTNNLPKKQYDFRFNDNGQVETIKMEKVSPIDETSAKLTERYDAMFHNGDLSKANRTKYQLDGTEVLNEQFKK